MSHAAFNPFHDGEPESGGGDVIKILKCPGLSNCGISAYFLGGKVHALIRGGFSEGMHAERNFDLRRRSHSFGIFSG